MAFYGGYEGNIVDERYWSYYDHDFGVASPYHLGEPNVTDYYTSPTPPPAYYQHNTYSVSTYSDPINYTCSYNYYDYDDYSANQSEPKYLRYDPPPHYQVYLPSETKFTVSYSNVELDEPVFEEYDPTPYDGGYDQTLTYGKPLPPSDHTCYPRSLPQSDAPPLESPSFASIPSPYGKDDDRLPIEPPNEIKPAADTETEAEGRVGNGEKAIIDDGEDVEAVEPRDVIPSSDYPAYQHQIPYGSGLETMDLCESLFGYWPCLAKKAQQQNCCQVCDQDRRGTDPWETAADYIFGSSVPYDYDNYHHHQSPYQSAQIPWLQ